jgi:hypothetical protein
MKDHHAFVDGTMQSLVIPCSSSSPSTPPSPRQDLVVLDVLPQMVALSESYFQVYQCQQQQQPPKQKAAKPKQQQPAGTKGS